ncbi:hypothetical protein [Empedobacter tilapiae]
MKNLKKTLLILFTATLLFNCSDDKASSQEEYYEQVKSSKEYKELMKTVVDGFDQNSDINTKYVVAKTEEAKNKMQRGEKKENINFSSVESFDKDIQEKTNESLFSGKAYEENKKAAKNFYAKYPEFLTDKEKQEFLVNEATKELNLEKRTNERLKKYNELTNQ